MTQLGRRTLSYWCFNPGVAMQELAEQKVRSIILTRLEACSCPIPDLHPELRSGTLSPMESFAYELKMPFPVRLENPHVIRDDQVWVSVVDKGPSGVALNSSFNNRSDVTYLVCALDLAFRCSLAGARSPSLLQAELGNTIVNFARVIPDGVLVFFPSYSVRCPLRRLLRLSASSLTSRVGVC